MWNRVKKLSVINTKMSSIKPDEIAIEAINAPLSSEITTTTITDPILHEKLDQVVPDDDDSSIEALAWTDFTDDELEIAKEMAAKEFPSNDPKEEEDEDHDKKEREKENMDPISVSESQISEESCNSNSKESEEECSVMSTSTSQTLVLTGNDGDEDGDGDITIVNYKDGTKQGKNNMEIEETMSGLVPKSSGSIFEDKASNAPVLDDGPIWGTGTKLYKFQENRERNQKLTFWVVMSVVLAIGVGVGNLVAYNEYENETKPIDQQHCPAPHIPTVSPYNPSNAEPSVDMKVLDKNFGQDIGKDNHFSTLLKSPELGESSTTSSSYVSSIHTETLAHVVKSIDELSKKIDIFNNTTKQLSGIIVMKEDLKSKVRSSEDEFSQFLPTFNDDLSRKNQWENKMDEPVCSPPNQKRVNTDEKLKPINHDIPKKQEKDTTSKTNNNDKSKLKPKEPKNHNKSKNNNAGEELNNEVSGKQKKEKNPEMKNTDEKYQKYKTKVEKSRVKQDKYEKNKQQQYAAKVSNDGKQENKKYFQKEKSIVTDNGEENDQHFHYQQGKQKKFKRETTVDNREYENDKYNKKSKKSKTRKAEYDSQNYNNIRDEKSLENDNQNVQKQKNVHKKPEKEYYEKEYKSDKKSKKPKKNKDDTKFVINENQGNSFFVSSETIPKKRKHSEKEIEKNKNKNTEKPQSVDGKNGKKYKKDKQTESSSDEENYNQKSNVYNKQVKVSDHKMNNKDQDWNSERAKARENNRVYQNWNSDFNSDNDYKIKRKRSSSWQIERDRLREKIRKNEDD